MKFKDLSFPFFKVGVALFLFFATFSSCDVLKELQTDKLNPLWQAAKKESIGFANQKLSKEIATKLGFTPLLSLSRGDRRLSVEQRQNAHRAYQLFLSHQPQIAVNDNTNTDSKAKLAKMQQDMEAVTHRYEILTDTDIYAIEQAFMPFIHHLEQITKQPSSSHLLAVHPQQKRTITFQGYCLDKGIPAPKTQDSFQLLPLSDLLPKDANNYYQSLLEYGHQTKQHHAVQGLLWRLVHGIHPEKEPTSLSTQERQLLDKAVPGGANGFYQYLQGKYTASQYSLNALYQNHGRELVQGFLNKHLNPVFGNSGVAVDMYHRDLRSSAEIEDYLLRLSQLPVQGINQPNTEYTLLANQVAARSVSTKGLRQMTMEIVNHSNEVYYYDPTQYIGFSTRKTQPVGHYPETTEPEPEVKADDLYSLAGIEGILDLIRENPEFAVGGILAFGAVAITRSPQLIALLLQSYRWLIRGGIRVGENFGKLGKAVQKPTLNINSFSKHAVNQAITRGVSPSALLNTVRKPLVVLKQNSGNHLYLSRDAVVVLNPKGKLVTTYPSSTFDKGILNILKRFN